MSDLSRHNRRVIYVTCIISHTFMGVFIILLVNIAPFTFAVSSLVNFYLVALVISPAAVALTTLSYFIIAQRHQRRFGDISPPREIQQLRKTCTVTVRGKPVPARIWKGFLTLDLRHKHLTSIAEVQGLDGAVSLQALRLDGNQLRKIEGLEHLTNLQVLSLANNCIEAISGLENFANLRVLNLARNQIAAMGGLDALANLQVLNLTNNQITAIGGLEHNACLSVLNLEKNQVAAVTGIGTLANLRELWLRWNPLRAATGYEHLAPLRTIKFGTHPYHIARNPSVGEIKKGCEILYATLFFIAACELALLFMTAIFVQIKRFEDGYYLPVILVFWIYICLEGVGLGLFSSADNRLKNYIYLKRAKIFPDEPSNRQYRATCALFGISIGIIIMTTLNFFQFFFIRIPPVLSSLTFLRLFQQPSLL